MQTLKVEIRREKVLPLEKPTVQMLDNQSLVPVGSSHSAQTPTGSNKLGNLEISRTTIQFASTLVGKTSGKSDVSYSVWCYLFQNWLDQGCGSTMPDLSNLSYFPEGK